MTNKIKILIGDDSAQYGVACASSLRAMGFFVITRPKDGLTIYDAIKNEQPDVVIADAVMPSLDAIELIRKIQNSSYQKPLFIIFRDGKGRILCKMIKHYRINLFNTTKL